MNSGFSAHIAGISLLTSKPNPSPAQNLPVMFFNLGPVHETPSDDLAFFQGFSDYVQTASQDSRCQGQTPHSIIRGRQAVIDKMAVVSPSTPEGNASVFQILQTQKGQLIKSQLEL